MLDLQSLLRYSCRDTRCCHLVETDDGSAFTAENLWQMTSSDCALNDLCAVVVNVTSWWLYHLLVTDCDTVQVGRQNGKWGTGC
mmetsp:Transcript_11519/g.20431  ORF Transcript_11519/g.20431 Transcript_11519/m.20431 type:complete len:84 (+) Transcript_11519:835-1086(+)